VGCGRHLPAYHCDHFFRVVVAHHGELSELCAVAARRSCQEEETLDSCCLLQRTQQCQPKCPPLLAHWESVTEFEIGEPRNQPAPCWHCSHLKRSVQSRLDFDPEATQAHMVQCSEQWTLTQQWVLTQTATLYAQTVQCAAALLFRWELQSVLETRAMKVNAEEIVEQKMSPLVPKGIEWGQVSAATAYAQAEVPYWVMNALVCRQSAHA